MYGLSAADEDIQARARVFADELIPLEVQAELDGGLPDGKELPIARARLKIADVDETKPVAPGDH